MVLIPLVANRSEEIAELSRKHQVQCLDVFGSAATGDFDPESSDLNFLVTFLPEANATYIGVYQHVSPKHLHRYVREFTGGSTCAG